MASTRSSSPTGTDRSSDAGTDISTEATSINEQMDVLSIEDNSAICERTIQEALKGARVLITGAAGFVGAGLCYRLLADPSFDVKQVVAIVRGETEQQALQRLPKAIQHLAESQHETQIPKLVVVNGDCAKPNFGLSNDEFEKVRKTEIVIHCAGDTRFTLPTSQAFQSMVDLGYFTARFSLLTWNVRTHIHVSTTFTGWYLPHGSVVSETLTPQGCGARVDEHEQHVNTYLHSKTYAESCVNSLFTSQVGRNLHGKSCRIVRLATLGPALEFPRPGWGSGHPSSPVCAVIAADVVGPTDLARLASDGGLDVIPVDLAVNQILAIAASAHSLQKLPQEHRLHPKNPAARLSQHLAEVPCYHVACGRGSEARISMSQLNDPANKIAEPYIPASNLLKVYFDFVRKVVEFDVIRTRSVLGIETLEADRARSLKKASLNDLPLKAGSLQLDIVRAVQERWGTQPGQAWTAYLQMCRDEMESMGPRSDWETFVD